MQRVPITRWPEPPGHQAGASQQNPEKDWGNDTLAAGRYAMFVLNDRYGTAANPVPFTPENTIVIAGSASNGGAASLGAAEKRQRWAD